MNGLFYGWIEQILHHGEVLRQQMNISTPAASAFEYCDSVSAKLHKHKLSSIR